MRTLRAIFFDIDDTLYSTTEFAERARRNSIRAMIEAGLRADPDQCYAELREVISEFTSNYHGHYDKLLLRLSPRAYEPVNPEILVAAAVVAYHQTKVGELRPYPDVLPFLKTVSRTGLMLGIISAGLAVKQAEKLVRLGVLPFLDPSAIFISERIGISKPNPKLYQRACEAAGVSPREAMYVGDDPLFDIDPPNRLGMATVRVMRGGRHDRERGRTRPTHSIQDFRQFLAILRKNYRPER